MNELMVKDELEVEDMIYEIRGKQVMLASDAAKLYCVATKRINEVVKRNINRFPTDFCFKLNSEEWNILRSQIATSSDSNNIIQGGIRYLPYVFTEHGVMMISGLLKSDIAIRVNMQIIDAFVKIRRYVSNDLLEQGYYNKMTIRHDAEIKMLQESLDNLSKKDMSNHIFFEGQIYDAYSKIIDIFNDSKKEIIIIDNYLDKYMLDIISKAKVKVTLVTADKLDNVDLTKYRSQYDNLDVVINKSFHDRFIILDKNVVYHLGASLNTLGKKCFAITKMEDEDILNELLTKIAKISRK